MDPKIRNLNSTTFFGRRFTRNEIAEIQETVAYLPGNSRKELAQTICEHVNWYTPKGEYRWNAALRLLEQLEELGILTLPAKRKTVPGKRRSIKHTSASDPQEEISCDLGELEPLTLAAADDDPVDKALWNELVDRHHYLNCPTPFGSSLRWFVVDRHGRKLACLLLEAGTRSLPARDQWLGWDKGSRERRLHLVLNNSRFLILPWVKVPNLASKVLSMAVAKLPDEWHKRYKCRPVLLETFVDPTRYDGACYKAANWDCIGMSAGRASKRNSKPAKEIYVQPLERDFREVLTGKIKPRRSKPKSQRPECTDAFVALWIPLIADATRLARSYDQQWMQRHRVLNSLLIILFVFRLVLAKGPKGYATILGELWEQCRKLGITLPQPRPVAASSICKARQRVDEKLFLDLHQIILHHGGEGKGWKGHRVLAIDGSKMNLPHPLVTNGYPLPHPRAHYPQGLVSCLYRLGDGVPIDFSLSSNYCERTAAKGHFKALRSNDIVIFDRGYFSFELLHDLHRRGVHPVFRASTTNSAKVFQDFMTSAQTETVVTATPQRTARRKLLERWPEEELAPLKLRLVRRTRGKEDVYLATTLTDTSRYTTDELSDLYHQRWSIEELYKISKHTIEVDSFHGLTERGVRQELYAHFNLIAMARLLAFPGNEILAAGKEPDKECQKVNLSHTLSIMAAGIEELMLTHAKIVAQTVQRMATEILRIRSRIRPNRSYPRHSMQPSLQGKRLRYSN